MAAPMTSVAQTPWARYLRRVTRWIPIESGNYPYVTARVRAKKAGLLSQDIYERMLQMEIPQIARILSEGAYKAEILALATKASGVDLIELATSRNLAAVYTQIIGFSEGELRQMIGWYLDRFDVQNVKTIVRGKLFGASVEEMWCTSPIPTMETSSSPSWSTIVGHDPSQYLGTLLTMLLKGKDQQRQEWHWLTKSLMGILFVNRSTQPMEQS